MTTALRRRPMRRHMPLKMRVLQHQAQRAKPRKYVLDQNAHALGAVGVQGNQCCIFACAAGTLCAIDPTNEERHAAGHTIARGRLPLSASQQQLKPPHVL